MYDLRTSQRFAPISCSAVLDAPIFDQDTKLSLMK